MMTDMPDLLGVINEGSGIGCLVAWKKGDSWGQPLCNVTIWLMQLIETWQLWGDMKWGDLMTFGGW